MSPVNPRINKVKSVARMLLGAMIVGGYVAALFIDLGDKALAALGPLAGAVVTFYFKKSIDAKKR